jgi:hypothetical protein
LVYLVCLVCLVKPDRPNEPDKQNKPVSASCEGVLQFFRWGEMVSPQPPLNADGPDKAPQPIVNAVGGSFTGSVNGQGPVGSTPISPTVALFLSISQEY